MCGAVRGGGGLDEKLTRRLLAPGNPPPVLVDALLAISQLARITARHYSAIARANLYDPIGAAVQPDPVFSQSTLRLVSALETKI